MSLIVDQLKKIKLLLSAEPPVVPPVAPAPVAPAPVAQSASDYTTNEGLVLSIDKLEVGGIVLKDATPVDDNTYTLVDGTSFSTKNGVIDAVISQPTPAPEPVVDEEMKKELAVVKQQFAAVKLENETTTKSLEAKVLKQESIIKEMFAAIELMGQQSSQKPVETTVEWDKLSTLEKRRYLKTN